MLERGGTGSKEISSVNKRLSEGNIINVYKSGWNGGSMTFGSSKNKYVGSLTSIWSFELKLTVSIGWSAELLFTMFNWGPQTH